MKFNSLILMISCVLTTSLAEGAETKLQASIKAQEDEIMAKLVARNKYWDQCRARQKVWADEKEKRRLAGERGVYFFIGEEGSERRLAWVKKRVSYVQKGSSWVKVKKDISMPQLQAAAAQLYPGKFSDPKKIRLLPVVPQGAGSDRHGEDNGGYWPYNYGWFYPNQKPATNVSGYLNCTKRFFHGFMAVDDGQEVSLTSKLKQPTRTAVLYGNRYSRPLPEPTKEEAAGVQAIELIYEDLNDPWGFHVSDGRGVTFSLPFYAPLDELNTVRAACGDHEGVVAVNQVSSVSSRSNPLNGSSDSSSSSDDESGVVIVAGAASASAAARAAMVVKK